MCEVCGCEKKGMCVVPEGQSVGQDFPLASRQVPSPFIPSCSNFGSAKSDFILISAAFTLAAGWALQPVVAPA
jgi:hypothetical protein